MTIKKYRVHDWVKFDYSEISEYIGEGYTDKPLRNDEIVELLNQLSEENEQLKSELNKQSEIAKNLGDFRGFIIEEQMKLNNDYNSLKEENEQLKSELSFWKKQAKQCPMRSCNE